MVSRDFPGPFANGERRVKLTLFGRYVEEEQAKRLHQLSHIHLRHHETIDVPAWGRV